MAPNVSFCRPLVEGMRGNDVVAHKRAVARALPAHYKWQQFTPYFGPVFKEAVKELQRRKGIRATGKIGKATHEALEQNHRANHPREWAFDALAIKLAADFCKEFTKSPEDKVREAIVDAAFYWYANRYKTAYSQYRPMQLGKPPWVPSRADCSGFATLCQYAGGAHDPNGRGYDHLGYTGTLMATGTRVRTISDLLPADLIFYGYSYGGSAAFSVGDPTHVAIYVGLHEGTHSVISDGHYPMGLYKYNYRSVNHFRHYDVI